MRRILLVVEDYNELVFLETLYKKVGLDVEGMQNDVAAPEKLLGFSPDMIVLSTYGTRVNAVRLLSKVKRKDGCPKVILLFQKSRPGSEKDLKNMVDAMFESPIHPRFLLEATEKLLKIEPNSLMKKMERFDTSSQDDNKMQHIKGDGGKVVQFPLKNQGKEEKPRVPISEYRENNNVSEEYKTKKKHRYQAWVDGEHLPPFQGINHERVAEIEKEWRKREDDPDIQQIDEERKAFVKALFEKSGKK
ncbi:MAG: hypothetical protein ABL958_10820 [Bdellovibrionia bacterium]